MIAHRLVANTRMIAIGIAAALAIGLGTPLALAQTDAKALADSLFGEGRRLMEEGEHEAACGKFEASQKLDPQLGTLLNLGICFEKVDRIASAWSTFKQLATLAERAGQTKRATYAAQRVELLEGKLSHLTLTVTTSVEGQEVLLDDHVIDPAAYGTKLAVDHGMRSIQVRAPGYVPWASSVNIPPNETIDLVVPALQPEPRPEPASPPVPSIPPVVLPAPSPPSAPPEPSGLWPWIYGAYALGGAGLVVGGITGGLALSEAGGLDCPNAVCSQAQADTLDAATTLANVSNAMFAIGAAGAVTGTVMLIVALGHDGQEQVSVRTSLTGASMTLSF